MVLVVEDVAVPDVVLDLLQVSAVAWVAGLATAP